LVTYQTMERVYDICEVTRMFGPSCAKTLEATTTIHKVKHWSEEFKEPVYSSKLEEIFWC